MASYFSVAGAWQISSFLFFTLFSKVFSGAFASFVSLATCQVHSPELVRFAKSWQHQEMRSLCLQVEVQLNVGIPAPAQPQWRY